MGRLHDAQAKARHSLGPWAQCLVAVHHGKRDATAQLVSVVRAASVWYGRFADFTSARLAKVERKCWLLATHNS